jgi:GTPase
MLTLAIIGRPNVGKSTLFNRLARKQLAIVDDRPGVTRDWREAEAQLLDRPLRILDTAGLEERFDDSIQGRMRKQTEAALGHAHVVLFVIDGREGVTSLDEHFAQWLRRQNKPTLLLVNKCENDARHDAMMADAYTLNLGDPIAISAAHGLGMDELYARLMPFWPQTHDDETFARDQLSWKDDDLDALEGKDDFDLEKLITVDDTKPIRVAIVGRPNAGKSTLMNALLGEDRVMTGPEAGLTRDAIAADWEWQGRKFRLVDTAGLRKKGKINDPIERMAVDDSLRAIRLSQIVILVVDATQLMEKQDLQIASHVIEEGRALIIAVNKWDIVNDRTEQLSEFRYQLETSLAQVRNLPFVTLSALRETNLDKLMQSAFTTYTLWNKRVSTGKLNRWLENKTSAYPPPLVNGRPNRLRYMTQINIRPPTFAVWLSHPKELPETYQRYLLNALREDYELHGVPVRLLLRKSKNPFAN